LASPFTIAVRETKSRVAHFDASLPDELIEALWDEPEKLADFGSVLQLKRVRRTVRLIWASRVYVLKHYMEPTWQHAVKHSFQASRARRTWAATHRLADAGIATPRAVACIERRWGQLWTDSFMMYPYVEGQTLTEYFKHRLNSASTDCVWQQLQEIWQRLARIRVSLSDSNIRNFILDANDKIWAIDLDRTYNHRSRFITAYYNARTWRRLVQSVNRLEKRAA
jgi:hypothetical protein